MLVLSCDGSELSPEEPVEAVVAVPAGDESFRRGGVRDLVSRSMDNRRSLSCRLACSEALYIVASLDFQDNTHDSRYASIYKPFLGWESGTVHGPCCRVFESLLLIFVVFAWVEMARDSFEYFGF